MLSYSSDVTPRNFCVCANLKKQVAGKQFATDTSTKQALISWLQIHDTHNLLFEYQ